MHLLIPTFLSLLALSLAQITVYNTAGTTAPLSTPVPTTYAGDQAFNPVVLDPPPVPDPSPPSTFSLQLQNGGYTGLSIHQRGSFLGFSLEFAVASQIVGMNGSILEPTFLNLMANIQERVGSVNIRVGGNSLDGASMVGTLGSGQSEAVLYGTAIPAPLVFTEEFLYMLANVSSLVDINWYLGIPFNETASPRLDIAEYGRAILGNHLVGLQVGDQPDLYTSIGYRPYNYSPDDYTTEFGALINTMANPGNITLSGRDIDLTYLQEASKLLVGPNIISGQWTPEMVWDTGFVTAYKDNLAALAVEHYPASACVADMSAQEIFPSFLNHTSGVKLVEPYLNSAQVAQAAGKPLLMLETNSAACGGFPGVSDSFGAALWTLDYSLQMAYSNFSGAMFHVDGQNVSYNAFTPPPPLEGAYRQWTIGPVYYAALAMAETLGSSNISQVLDLRANNGSIYTPAYGIYENGNVSRVALFNYITDPTGESDYTVDISISSVTSQTQNLTPPTVWVKYLTASSVSQKGYFMWANQTFGGLYESDGLLQGTLDIQTVACTESCQISVPAPSFALVFFSPTALAESSSGGGNVVPQDGLLGVIPTKTFATTVTTVVNFTGTVDPDVLATSNGHRPQIKGHFGSTTKGRLIDSASTNTIFGLRALAVALMVCMLS